MPRVGIQRCKSSLLHPPSSLANRVLILIASAGRYHWRGKRCATPCYAAKSDGWRRQTDSCGVEAKSPVMNRKAGIEAGLFESGRFGVQVPMVGAGSFQLSASQGRPRHITSPKRHPNHTEGYISFTRLFSFRHDSLASECSGVFGGYHTRLAVAPSLSLFIRGVPWRNRSNKSPKPYTYLRRAWTRCEMPTECTIEPKPSNRALFGRGGIEARMDCGGCARTRLPHKRLDWRSSLSHQVTS